ncbi:MAG: acyl carrier protein [Hyphomicrobiales bacterium]|nr:acyl carrier protein [Hyphomicrobiales bacterium]MCP4997649.1 acyl carrier protein [Hyphomicrobiales bacterium]
MNESVTVIRQIVAEILLVPVERVDCHCALSQLPEWDSLTHLTLLLVIEEKTGQRLSADQLGRTSSVADVAQLLRENRPTLH